MRLGQVRRGHDVPPSRVLPQRNAAAGSLMQSWDSQGSPRYAKDTLAPPGPLRQPRPWAGGNAAPAQDRQQPWQPAHRSSQSPPEQGAPDEVRRHDSSG